MKLTGLESEKMEGRGMTTNDIELAVANYFNTRVNLIVPNISWGMFLHECDLLIITKNNYAYEVEIKTSKSDLIADQKKRHNHSNKKIKKLYFAIPDCLLNYSEYIPDYAGIITVGTSREARMVRQAQNKGDYKFTAEEKYNVARLGAMRIFKLKADMLVLQKQASEQECGRCCGDRRRFVSKPLPGASTASQSA